MNLKENSSIQIYKRLVQAALPYWFPFLLGILGNALLATSDGLLTYYFKPLVEKGFEERDQVFIDWIPWVIFFFFLARGISYFLATYFMSWVGRSVVRDFRQKMIAKLMKLPATFYDQKTTGELVSKINYDTDQVAEAISEAITSTIRGVLTTVSLITVMFSLNARITILLLITFPALSIYINRISKKMRKHSGQIQETMGRVTHVAGEVINGYQVVRTFKGQDYEYQRFSAAAETNWKQELKMTATSAWSVAGMQFIGVCALVAFLYLATIKPGSVLGTAMTTGTFIAMVSAILQLLRPIKQVAIVNSTLQRGIAGAKSIFALLDEPIEADLGKQKLSRAEGRIAFHNVEFYYPGRNMQEQILREINFVAEPGQTVALVGKSGSGKSTLVSLMPRFYNCSAGIITLDGINTNNIQLEDLRAQFALVTQNVTLFNDTVANNIAYGEMRGKPFSEIYQAAKLAHALEFIEKLPQGFNTEVGENGIRLSGGQRQRLAIARALLKNAPILILDEATSALDTESEQIIQEALETLMKDRTTLVVAHRLSTIEHADKVLVLDNGYIVESGTHAELIVKNGRYAMLHRAQFNDDNISENIQPNKKAPSMSDENPLCWI